MAKMGNSVFLITGTRKGIGRQLAEYYLNKGNVVFGCSRGEGAIDHINYFHYILDVSDEVAVIKMVKDIVKKYKKIDILINNAGIASMNHLVLFPLKTAKTIFDTNFFGTFLLLREVSKNMMRNKKGRIINFSTVAIPLKLEGEAIYAASKAAVVSLTEIAARELADFGITVNAIGPTPVLTDLIKVVPKDKINTLIERQPIKRLGTFVDILNVVDFFIDDKSEFITGQVIYLGGINH
jgi:3-oxoacyl-[acyl-carrier protein] reductase